MKNYFLILSMLTIVLVSCGKKEIRNELEFDSNARTSLEVDDQGTNTTIEDNEPPVIINTDELAVLVHNGTIENSVTINSKTYVYYALYVKNIGKTNATNLNFSSNISPFEYVDGPYQNKCEYDLDSGDECIIKVKIIKEVRSAVSKVPVSYLNGEGKRYLDLALYHDSLAQVDKCEGNEDCGDQDIDDQTDKVCFEQTKISIEGKDLAQINRHSKISLPYTLSSRKTQERLTLNKVGQTNLKLNLIRKEKVVKTLDTVSNAMTVLTFKLPKELSSVKNKSSVEVLKMEMSLDYKKVFFDSYPHTELICLLGQNICSGQKYNDSEFVHLINDHFWKRNNQLRSSDFSNMIVKKYHNTTGIGISHGNTKLNLSKMLVMGKSSLNEILSGDHSSINIVVGDDLEIHQYPTLYISIKTKKSSCNDNNMDSEK